MMSDRRRVAVATLERPAAQCCPKLHEAVELIGKRWSGAIIVVLLEGGAMRFSEIAQAIPQLSDRLLSERMKEREARGIVERERKSTRLNSSHLVSSYAVLCSREKSTHGDA